MDQEGSTESPAPEKLEFRVSPWFYRRLGLLILLTGGLGLYFLYDGAIGYPKKNFTVDLHEAFEAGRAGQDWREAVDMDAVTGEERRQQLREAHRAGREGGAWAGFAAELSLPEKVPERYSEAEIREQFHFAVLMGIVSLGIVGYGLLQRRRVFRCEAGRLVPPRGGAVRFERVERIDLRKWDRGLGWLHYRDDEGEERKLKLDDYKFSGLGEMLARLVEENPEVEVEGDRRWLSAGDPAEEEASFAGTSDDGERA